MNSNINHKQSETSQEEQIKQKYSQQLIHQWAVGYADGNTTAFAAILKIIDTADKDVSPQEVLDRVARFCDKSMNASRDGLIQMYEKFRNTSITNKNS